MPLPLLGAAIAGGSSLLGGLFSRSSAKKQAKREEDAIRKANDVATAQAQQMNKEIRARADAAALVPVATSREHAELTTGMRHSAGGVDMKAFMSAAEDYGFNPLTFLRSGALSLFATQTETSMSSTMSEDWTCTTGERAMDAALSGTYLPQLQPVIAQTRVPGMGDVLAGALQSGANQYLSDLSQQQNNDFQMDLLNAKLRGMNARPSGSPALSRSFYQPQAFLSGSVAKTSADAAKQDEALPLFVWAIDNTSGSKKDPFGNYRVVQIPNPKLSDSEQAAMALAARGLSLYDAWVAGRAPALAVPPPAGTPTGRSGQPMATW